MMKIIATLSLKTNTYIYQYNICTYLYYAVINLPCYIIRPYINFDDTRRQRRGCTQISSFMVLFIATLWLSKNTVTPPAVWITIDMGFSYVFSRFVYLTTSCTSFIFGYLQPPDLELIKFTRLYVNYLVLIFTWSVLHPKKRNKFYLVSVRYIKLILTKEQQQVYLTDKWNKWNLVDL